MQKKYRIMTVNCHIFQSRNVMIKNEVTANFLAHFYLRKYNQCFFPLYWLSEVVVLLAKC